MKRFQIPRNIYIICDAKRHRFFHAANVVVLFPRGPQQASERERDPVVSKTFCGVVVSVVVLLLFQIAVGKMTEVASSVIHEVLGRRVLDVDQPIVDYIVNVLADDDFDFGLQGEGAVDAIGELLIGSGCVSDDAECRSVRLLIRSFFFFF